LPCHISALPIQADQKILPSQLRRSQANQQLPGPEPAITLLDRSHRRVQRLDYPQPIHQLADRDHPRRRRQRRIRRADPHLPPSTPPTAYSRH
jgi:hypothetical protein